MRKIATTFLLIISIVSGIFTLSSCEKKIIKNDEAVEEMVTEDYIQFYWSDLPTGQTDDMYIKYFLGIYDNVYVAAFYDWKSIILPGDIVKIADFYFIYDYSTRIVVWKNHKFFEWSEAYEKGILNIEQIEKIHEQYLRYEWSEEIKNMLKEDYLKLILTKHPNAMLGGITLTSKLGCYDSLYVGIFHDSYSDYIDYTLNYSDESYFDKEAIGEFEFVYKNNFKIQVWKDHEFYLLKDAYDMDLINDEQLESIYKEYNKAVWRIRKY